MCEKEPMYTDTHSGQELLEELLAVEKKQTRSIRILMLANLVLVIAVLVMLGTVIPRITSMVENAETSLAYVQDLAGRAEESLDGIDVMVGNANSVLTENANGMTEALDHFNAVDFDGLNGAIKDLSDAISPLAKFARMFGN